MQRHLLVFMLLFTAPGFAQTAGSLLAYGQYFKNRECSPAAFDMAWRGYKILLDERLIKSPRYLTIIDFTKPSNVPRLFVLDVASAKLVLSTITAHGVGSDPDSTTIPYRFSNRDGSRMSSVGFYLTGDVYTNHRPLDSLGLCLFGLDKGYNDSAAKREIVVHYGATEYKGRVYVTDTGAARSYGCPALPLSTNTRVIELIRGGSLLFVYSNKEPQYEQRSTVLNRRLSLPIIQQGPPPNNCYCNLQTSK
jgi:hypothetical protein